MVLRPAASRTAGIGLLMLGLAAPAGANPSEIDYMLQCQGCHLPDGSGRPGSVPSLRDSVGRFVTVTGGREYLVRVPGSSSSSLSDEALARVLNWMIREFGPEAVASDFEPFSAAEVRRVRRPPLTDVDSVRSELLQRMQRGPRAE